MTHPFNRYGAARRQTRGGRGVLRRYDRYPNTCPL